MDTKPFLVKPTATLIRGPPTYLDNVFPSFCATLAEIAPGNFPLINVG